MEGPSPSVSQAYQFWKEFDLTELRSALDSQGLAIAERQESSVTNRRKLAETTKDFRRSANSTTVQQVGTLLKSYQSEVDQLTTRAKSGETAFLELYQKLYEAPDPAPCLLHSLELSSRNADLEAQIQRMAQELAEYKAESTELRNQDGIIKRLEERIRFLEASSKEKDVQIEENKNALAQASQVSVVQENAEREEKLLSALSEAQSSLSNLQKLHEASQKQLFNLQTRDEEERVGVEMELNIATAEMEKAQQRLISLEQEKESLQAQVQERVLLKIPENDSNDNIIEGLKNELSAQRQLASRLRSELNALSSERDQEIEGVNARCDGLRSALQAQEKHAEALDRELQTRPTISQVNELQQKLRILQAIGFGALESDEGQQETNPQTGPMERLLLEKTKKLDHELTNARLKIADSAAELEELRSKIVDLEGKLEEKNQLVLRLEEDLLAADTKDASTESNLKKQPSDTSFYLKEGNQQEGGERTMVSVVCGQRDRLRARVNELEEELAKVSRNLKNLTRDLDGAKADNLKLVERMKYIQGYKVPNKSLSEMEAGSVEHKYRNAYEENINPFSDWKQREKASRKKQLGLPERVLYEVGQVISTSKRARVFAVTYAVLLHLLIFFVIARWGHTPRHTLEGTELQLLCSKMTSIKENP